MSEFFVGETICVDYTLRPMPMDLGTADRCHHEKMGVSVLLLCWGCAPCLNDAQKRRPCGVFPRLKRCDRRAGRTSRLGLDPDGFPHLPDVVWDLQVDLEIPL